MPLWVYQERNEMQVVLACLVSRLENSVCWILMLEVRMPKVITFLWFVRRTRQT